MCDLDVAVQRLMDRHHQPVTPKKVAELARQIFVETSHSYQYMELQPGPCGNKTIRLPVFTTSRLSRTFMKKVRGSNVHIMEIFVLKNCICFLFFNKT